MPVVNVRLFPGRSDTVKSFVARGIVDVVSEFAGTSREGVHVIFDEVERGDWAQGPRLSTQLTRARVEDEPAYVTVGRINVQPEKHAEYLAWRRDSVYPYMAGHEGFVSSTVLTVPDDENQYVIVNKWVNKETYAAYTAHPREAELRVEAKQFVRSLVTEDFNGDVVDVFHRNT